MELFQKNLATLLIIVIVLIFPTRGAEKRNNLESYANRMKSYMNLDVDPCRDFYEYACGNYRHQNELLESMLDFWTLNYNSEQLEGQIEHLLGRMDLAESLNVSRELRVAQRFYNACLEADLHPFPATDPHYLTLIRSIGGFPAVDGANWNASNFSWFNMSSHLINYGQRPELGDERLGFEECENSRPNDEERMAGYLRAFQLPEDKISEVIAGVFAFLKDARSSHAQLSGNCKLFEANYFEIVWDGDKIVWNKDQPRKDEDCSSYVVKLDKVCARHPEAVANYLAMKLLRRLDAALHSTEEQKQYCLGQVKFSMRFLFSKLLLAEKFPGKKKSGVSEIVDEVWNTLSSSLDEDDRLGHSHSSRRVLWEFPFSFSKVNSFADRVISEIGSLEIVEDSYAATNINLHRLAVNSSRYSARHSMDLPMSSKSADHMLNEFSWFDRFLRPPFYHDSWPLALRFGAFGSVVARQAYVNVNGYDDRLDIRLEENKLRLAFFAYKNHIKHLQEDHKQDKINETMPGIDLPPDQLFFLGATQIFCDRSRRSRDRANYSIKYNKEFPQVFNCSAGYGK
ncbi:neprilysin-1-like [Drosophila takahashii]|uniref:neprilysin-1-like n=1 Tax=Drosophila takahashii TaxID=29030 RepID=UPI003898FDC3